MNLDCRNDFPSLGRTINGRGIVYLDGPGGTQVPQSVIEAIAQYYRHSNANSHGFFPTSNETDLEIQKVRESLAAFLGAEEPGTISIGQNMTTLNFSLSHALGRYFNQGDEVIITQLDHEANRGPWLGLEQYGLVVREALMTENGELDYQDLRNKINRKTKLIAVGWASNALGTVNNVEEVVKMAHNSEVMVVIDAVHYAPHFTIDVKRLGCDFLLCSSYKFYGPHLGFLYSKPGLLEQLSPDRLRTQEQKAPYLIETGTLNHAALAGASAAVQYLADFGEGKDLADQILDAKNKIQVHERSLAEKLYHGLERIQGLNIIGLPFGDYLRAPTLSFTVEGMRPETICAQLGERGICSWDGHFYAIRAIEALGLYDRGGVTRLGISIYNTEEEIDYTVEALEEIVTQVPTKNISSL